MASQREAGLNNSRESVTSRSITTEGQVSQRKVDLSVFSGRQAVLFASDVRICNLLYN